MHFFLSYKGEIIVRNYLHGEELLERHEAARNRFVVFPDFRVSLSSSYFVSSLRFE